MFKFLRDGEEEGLFLFINGQKYTVGKEVPAGESLNHFIRERALLKGTKYMCNEGGCGSCIVTLTTLDPIANCQVSRAVNSCLVPVHACLGSSVTTIEGLGNKSVGYNKIQGALSTFYGTQCGYCSPGMVMNMYSLLLENPNLTSQEVENSFGGNLCRCTGYRPILDAFKSLTVDAPLEFTSKVKDIEDILKPCSRGLSGVCGGRCKQKCAEIRPVDVSAVPQMARVKGGAWFWPRSLKELLPIMEELKGSYRLVGGNTAQGIYRTKEVATSYIQLSYVQELQNHSLSENGLEIGGSMTLTDVMKVMGDVSHLHSENFSYLEMLLQHMDLVANVPVRNVGTIAGNLSIKNAHNEFSSDIFLLLETVNATICVIDTKGKEMKYSPAEFVAANMTDRLIVKVILPVLSKKEYQLRTFKITPRAQNVRGYINAGFLLRLDEQFRLLSKPRIVYGGVSAEFVHPSMTEEYFTGKCLLSNEVITEGLRILNQEIRPVLRCDKEVDYIKNLAVCLFYKFILGLNPSGVDRQYRSGWTNLERPLSGSTHDIYTKPNWPENPRLPKVEGTIQCSGEAEFSNDLPPFPGELFGALVLARVATATIESIDPTPALAIPGVISFYSAKDIPGCNSFIQVAYITEDKEEVFCDGEVRFGGQPVGVIVAINRELSLRAAELVEITYSNKKRPFLSTKSVVEAAAATNDNSRMKLYEIIEPKTPTKKGIHRISGEIETGEQYHFHLELQTCICVPIEDGMNVFSSTQWMHNVQTAMAKFLNMSINSINMQVRRIGGGFGGKITRSAQVALACSLAAFKLNRPVRMVLSLETNMEALGKRDPFYMTYEASFNDDGKIQDMNANLYLDGGSSPNDPSNMLVFPGFFNYYETSTWNVGLYDVFSDIPGTSWMRGPGTIQGIVGIETILEHVAFTLGKEPQDIRLANMSHEEVLLSNLMNSVRNSSQYDRRKEEISSFNSDNRWRKKGIAMMSMKFPIDHYFDYHALVSIYGEDGSVSVTHGGVEMGQGLNTKVAQACAYALGISVDMVKIKPTTTLTSPNNGMSGASITSETCVYSVLKCAETLAKRLEPIRQKMGNPPWEKLVKEAASCSIDLMATGWLVFPVG